MQIRGFFISLIFFHLLCASAQSPQARPVDGFAAIVNGRVITVGDVVDFIRPQLEQLRRRNLPAREHSEEQDKLYTEGLERLIDQQLMIAKFEKLGAKLPPGAVRERTETILRERFNNNRAELLATLRKIGKSEKEWEDELRDQIIVQSMLQQYVNRLIHIPPARLREAYEARADEFRQPVELRLRSISFRPAAEGQEESRSAHRAAVLQRLRDGADFAEMAREFSEGPRASEGGDEGWVRPDSLPAPLREALAQGRVGEIIGPIDTPTQHFIFKIEDIRGGQRMSFAEAQSRLETDLRRVEFERIQEEWMRALRQEFPVFRFAPSGALQHVDL